MATCAALPELHPDDRPLIRELERRDVFVEGVVWDSAQGTELDAVMLRSVWDYHLRVEEFLTWVGRFRDSRTFWNSAALVSWNAKKTYLRDLAARGVATVDTLWLEERDLPRAEALIHERGWGEIVVKPAVSASAHDTHRFTAARRAEALAHARALAQRGIAMVQPYLDSVEGYGERSFIFVDGEYTHGVQRQAVLSKPFESEAPAPRVEPTTAEFALCAATLAALDETPLYARVDIAPDAQGTPRLMELELIEPRLYFREAPASAARMADTLASRLT